MDGRTKPKAGGMMIYVGYSPEGFRRKPEVFFAREADAIPADVLNCTRFDDADEPLAKAAAERLAREEGVEVTYPTGL